MDFSLRGSGVYNEFLQVGCSFFAMLLRIGSSDETVVYGSSLVVSVSLLRLHMYPYILYPNELVIKYIPLYPYLS